MHSKSAFGTAVTLAAALAATAAPPAPPAALAWPSCSERGVDAGSSRPSAGYGAPLDRLIREGCVTHQSPYGADTAYTGRAQGTPDDGARLTRSVQEPVLPAQPRWRM